MLPCTDRGPSAKVAFMDIKSASKARDAKNEIDGVVVLTEYNERQTDCLSTTDCSNRSSGYVQGKTQIRKQSADG